MLVKGTEAFKKPAFSLMPDFISESVAAINFSELKKRGIKVCLIDLDGTVVGTGSYNLSKETIDTINNSSMDFYIATNRLRRFSLKTIAKELDVKGVIHPEGIFFKPSKKYYQQATISLGLNPAETVMIGDRYIQDMLGSNRAGIYSLLVHKYGPHKGFADKFLSKIERKITSKISASYNPI